MRIAVAGIRFETNSFSPGSTSIESFEARYVRAGREVEQSEPGSEVRGALDQASEAGHQAVPVFDTYGGCGPKLSESAYLTLRRQLLANLARALPVDAVYLALHGAMATESADDADGALTAAVAAMTGGRVPIVVSLDLHGAPSDLLLASSAAVIGYKTCPHVDAEETGRKAMRIAIDAATGAVVPKTLQYTIPILTPAEIHDTTDGPLSEVLRVIHRDAADAGLLDESVFMCQPWLDARRSSWSLTAVVDSRRTPASPVLSLMRRHASMIDSHRAEFSVRKLLPGVAVRRLAPQPGLPLLLIDSGDSPSAGAPGDSPELIAAILGTDAPVGSPHASVRSLCVVTDAPAVARCWDLGAGARVSISLGASRAPHLYRPIAVDAVVVGKHHATYTSTFPPGPMTAGRTAVLQSGEATIVVTSEAVPMLDPALYRSLGLPPEGFDAVQVKSAGGYRARWAGSGSLVLATRGASDSDLRRLPFSRLRSEIWLPTATTA